MENENEIAYPTKDYFSHYKDEVINNANEIFDDYLAKAEVDVELNRTTAAKYRQKVAASEQMKKKRKGKSGVGVFLIFVAILFFIIAVTLIAIAINMIANRNTHTLAITLFFIIGFVLIGLGIFFIILKVKKINKQLAEFDKNIAALDKEAQELYNKCVDLLKLFVTYFHQDLGDKVLMKTTPSITMDPTFDLEKYAYLTNKFEIGKENDDENSSTIFTKTGTISTNPFLIVRFLYMQMIQKTYYGSRTVTYTTTYRDSNGNTRTSYHTQTLTASVSKPAPSYPEGEALVYPNRAAPNLSFTRTKAKVDSNDDKAIQRNIKKLEKKSQKELMDKDPTTNYTMVDNQEFEVLYNATNRDNEVEFRLLFTPLGQANTLDLIKNSPYGDDFNFVKKKMVNFIYSGHAIGNFKLRSGSISNYISYDVDIMRNNFIKFASEYFKSYYFEFAPILSIPIYQQQKPEPFAFDNDYEFNFPPYQHEVYANIFDSDFFTPDEASTVNNTENLLKTNYIRSVGNADFVEVIANNFYTVEHVDYVPKTARDGSVYDVAVPWLEYIPVSKTSRIVVLKTKFTFDEMTEVYVRDEKVRNLCLNIADEDAIMYTNNCIGFVIDENENVDDKIKALDKVLNSYGDKKEKVLWQTN